MKATMPILPLVAQVATVRAIGLFDSPCSRLRDLPLHRKIKNRRRGCSEQAEKDFQTAKQNQEQLQRTRALQEKARTTSMKNLWKGAFRPKTSFRILCHGDF